PGLRPPSPRLTRGRGATVPFSPCLRGEGARRADEGRLETSQPSKRSPKERDIPFLRGTFGIYRTPVWYSSAFFPKIVGISLVSNGLSQCGYIGKVFTKCAIMPANDESKLTGWAGDSRFLFHPPASIFHPSLKASLNLSASKARHR